MVYGGGACCLQFVGLAGQVIFGRRKGRITGSGWRARERLILCTWFIGQSWQGQGPPLLNSIAGAGIEPLPRLWHCVSWHTEHLVRQKSAEAPPLRPL